MLVTHATSLKCCFWQTHKKFLWNETMFYEIDKKPTLLIITKELIPRIKLNTGNLLILKQSCNIFEKEEASENF